MRNLSNPAALLAVFALLSLGLTTGCAGPGESVGVQDDDQLEALDSSGSVDSGGLGDRMK